MTASILTMQPAQPAKLIRAPFHAYGGAAALFRNHTARELVLSGPAGTGKTRAWLELMHYRAASYPGSRHLMLRKTFASLKASALVTFDSRVDPFADGVVFKGETAKRPPSYLYPNGSEIVIGGMDRASKVMSSEYDTIYVPECTELDEADWEALTTRIRWGAMPYQQVGGDCNPDAPDHWIQQRARAGTLALLLSRHQDNPSVTADYLAGLSRLTGVRRLRLYLGVWAAAEGMIYQDSWDRSRNLRDRFPRRAATPLLPANPHGDPPREWARYLAVDFGYVNPTVVQWWAEDGDGRLYRYRELYVTRRLVSDIAETVKSASQWGEPGGDPLPRAIICDHDAENRAQFEHALGMLTTPARKSVLDGINAVAERLRPSGDGRPRLFLLRDSLIDADSGRYGGALGGRDPLLVDAKLPTCTEEEIEGYVWDTSRGQRRGEAPVKENDHGLDALRYMVAHRDLRLRTTEIRQGPRIWGNN